jgi:hypothetical protein
MVFITLHTRELSIILANIISNIIELARELSIILANIISNIIELAIILANILYTNMQI